MCEQLGQEPNPEEIPPDIEDFPEIAVQALTAFSNLGDRIYPDIGYMGKDFTTLPYYIDMYEIKDTELFLTILTYLESRAIKTSQEQLKREREKLKRKK
jgi:hypothetical protein